MTFNIIMMDQFKKELYNVIYYIEYILMEPNIAKKLYNKIIEKIYTLEQFTEGYPKAFYDNSNIRKFFVTKYIIFYEVLKLKRRSSYLTYLSFKSKLSKKILIKSKNSKKLKSLFTKK